MPDAHVTERGTHNDGFVTILLIIVENLLDGNNTRVFVTLKGLASRLLVPIQDLCGREINRYRIEGLFTRPTKGEISVTPASAQATA